MGYDIHGTWSAANPDGTFETLQLDRAPDDSDLAYLGHSPELVTLFGGSRSPLAIAPLPQTGTPVPGYGDRFTGVEVQGCVTLADLLAYDYEAPVWQTRRRDTFGQVQPVSFTTWWLRERTLPRVRALAAGREVYFTYVIF